MKDNNQNLIAASLVTLFVASCLGMIFSRTDIGGKHEAPNTDTTPWYDSAFVYEMKNYRVDVLYNSRKDEIRLLFRNQKEPDSFNVHITPITPDFETYRGDICSRFIDVHEANLCRAYEYYAEYRNGQVIPCGIRNRDIPIIDEFNVRLVKRKNPSTGQLETFIIRNKRFEREFTTWEMQL